MRCRRWRTCRWTRAAARRSMALACDQLVMQPEAHVGGKGSSRARSADARRRRRIASAIRSARTTDHSWSLLAAMIDPDIELFTYHNTKTGEVRYFCGGRSERASRRQGLASKARRSRPPASRCGWRAKRAEELGVASHVVDSFDEFKQLYGFDDDPRMAEPNWALELVEALSSPVLATVCCS